MTQDEKDRFEIAKELCGLQNLTLQEVYDFIKGGKTSIESQTNELANGIYVVYADGKAQKFPGERLISTDAEVTGIAVKQGDRALVVALRDAADGEEDRKSVV